MDNNYPEHEKLKAIHGKNQGMGAFLENTVLTFGTKKLIDTSELLSWLNHDVDAVEPLPTVAEAHKFVSWLIKYRANEKRNDVFRENRVPKILADYYGIDEQKLDQEKRQMLDEIRTSNK